MEIDAPARSISREIEIDVEPEIASAIAGTDAGSAAAHPHEPEEPAGEPAAAQPLAARGPALDLTFDIGALLPAKERARTPEEQHEQRVRRAITRLQTARDAFRLMGLLGLAEAERKAAARMFMELDAALGRAPEGQSAIKDPDGVLAAATTEQLDTVDRLMAPIEDRLLLLDQQVGRDAFESACENRKVTRKVLLRYGRLLASRRFQADERRTRFEWIATQLLAPVDAHGVRRPLPREHVRAVLERLIGGLPHKTNEEELGEALSDLREAITRVQQFTTAEEFFESGFYVDAYGYKVTMRDHLLAPEFLYLSVMLNTAVHNRLEEWIADLERLHSANQLRAESSPRDQITHRLREQEDEVDSALGVRRRPAVHSLRSEAVQEAEAQVKPKAKERKKKRSLDFEIVWDRQMVLLVGSLISILAVTFYLLTYTGAIGRPTIHAMTAAEMRAVSPLLARAWLIGDGEDRRLRATVMPHRWDATEPRTRREQAERIVAALAKSGVRHGEVKRGEQVVIQIADGFLVEVVGGKL